MVLVLGFCLIPYFLFYQYSPWAESGGRPLFISPGLRQFFTPAFSILLFDSSSGSFKVSDKGFLVLFFMVSPPSKPLVKYILHCCHRYFPLDVITILLCKGSTSGDGKGTHPACSYIFFRLFGCSCSYLKNSMPVPVKII